MDGHKIGIEKITKDTETKLKEIFDLWKNGPTCMTDILLPAERHPYYLYADETEFLVVAKLAKKFVCDSDQCGVRPNYIDETKKFLFREMRTMVLKISLNTDASCIQYHEELKDASFTLKSISEQQSVLDNIQTSCLDTNMKTMYAEWFKKHGDKGDCRGYFKFQCPGKILQCTIVVVFDNM